MIVPFHEKFDAAAFLANAGLGRKIVRFKAKHVFFTQGTEAYCVFYLQSGRAKLTVVSARGKEATITLRSPPATSSGRSPSPPSPACAWPPPPPSPPASLSKSSAKR